MYYLFLRKQDELAKFRAKFDEVKENIEKGKTPVFNEMACAKNNMFETVPYNLILGIFVILGATSNFIFTMIKHRLRIRLCRRLRIEPTERNIAVLESLEYQSV